MGIHSVDKSTRIGSLGKSELGLGVGGSGSSGGRGSPGGDTNVAAWWKMDEASGDIVDEITSITLANTDAPTYGVSIGAPFAAFSPGITITTAGDTFKLVDTPAGLSIGTNDFTVEWLEKSVAVGARGVFDTSNDGAGGGMEIYWGSGTVLNIDCYQAAGNSFLSAWTVSSVLDGAIRAFRATFDRSGNSELFINNVSQGTVDISAGVAKTVGVTRVVMGGVGTGVVPLKGTISNWRLSLNLTNNLFY